MFSIFDETKGAAKKPPSLFRLVGLASSQSPSIPRGLEILLDKRLLIYYFWECNDTVIRTDSVTAARRAAKFCIPHTYDFGPNLHQNCANHSCVPHTYRRPSCKSFVPHTYEKQGGGVACSLAPLLSITYSTTRSIIRTA
jgi:hypothetical protein